MFVIKYKTETGTWLGLGIIVQSKKKSKTKQNNAHPGMVKHNSTILDEWKDNNWTIKLRKSPVVCIILEFTIQTTHQVMELSCFILANYANALVSFVCGVTEWHCLIFHHLGPCCRSCQELHLCPPHMRSSDSQWTQTKSIIQTPPSPVCVLSPLFSPYHVFHKRGEKRESLHSFHLPVILHFWGTSTPLHLLHGRVSRRCMWHTCYSHSGDTNLHEHIKNVIVQFSGQRARLL